MADLRERVPGHSLIDELLRQWDLGTIHVDPKSNGVVIDEEAEGWYRGVLGERRVASILADLGPEWTVLHSVPVGAGTSDIDHVVVGPPGVFTINTKFSPGKDVWVAGRGMYVGGSRQAYTVNAIHEARRASTYLSRASGLTVPVTGIVVFVDPGRMTYKAPAGGEHDDPVVQVLNSARLLDTLRGRTEFSADHVAKIANAASAPETWSRSPKLSSRGTHIVQEFQALEEAVGPRLALPRAVPSTPNRGRAMPSPARKPTRRKPKRTRLEILFAELALPLAGFVFLWIWYANSRH